MQHPRGLLFSSWNLLCLFSELQANIGVLEDTKNRMYSDEAMQKVSLEVCKAYILIKSEYLLEKSMSNM